MLSKFVWLCIRYSALLTKRYDKFIGIMINVSSVLFKQLSSDLLFLFCATDYGE